MQAEKVEARNSFEAYVFSLRHTLEEKGFQDKLPAEDYEALKAATAEALEWLEENTSADKGEVREHYLTPTLSLTLTMTLTMTLTPTPTLPLPLTPTPTRSTRGARSWRR